MKPSTTGTLSTAQMPCSAVWLLRSPTVCVASISQFTPHVDTGDFIVVVNAEKIRVTGNKADDKKYFRHSGYPGGISETTFSKMQDRFPGRALEIAVKGMLPKGPLGYAMIKKLKIYAGESHPHSAQQPKALAIN